jgi:hypothetical protein
MHCITVASAVAYLLIKISSRSKYELDSSRFPRVRSFSRSTGTDDEKASEKWVMYCMSDANVGVCFSVNLTMPEI